MNRSSLRPALTLVLTVPLGACSKGWRLDYGEPEAQFLDSGIAAEGPPYVGKMVTVKGTVARIDVSDPEGAWVELAGGIRCHLGDLQAMAGSQPVGATVYVDGFLERCEAGDVVLDSAVYRDPTAPFSPREGTSRSVSGG